MHAIDLILSKLTDDSHYLQNMHAPLSYAGVTLTISFTPSFYWKKELLASMFTLYMLQFFSYLVLVPYEFIILVIRMVKGTIMM